MSSIPFSSLRSVRRTTILTIAGFAFLVVAAGLLRLCVGREFGWPGGDLVTAFWRIITAGVWREEGSDSNIFLEIRLYRVVLAVLVGVALATSGVALQSLLRNPLAEPFILGLSSGAGVGVMTEMLAAYYLELPSGTHHTGALLGASVSMLIVYAAGQRQGAIDPLGLLLAGVVLSTINGAIIVLLNYLPGSTGLREDLARWMMGYLNETLMDSSAVLAMIAIVVLGFATLLYLGPAMDVATFSDTEAMSLGVNLRRLRVALFVVAAVLAAGAVVLAGPIAFVGLICPHAVRLLLGPTHRPLIIGSAMIGAALIILADTATVWLDFGQGHLPLGVFTAVLGGPIFVWMLRPQIGRGMD